jgi:predicted nucleic acid-binding protein
VTRRVVCDASALTALVIDGGPDGLWVTASLTEDLTAPSLASSTSKRRTSSAATNWQASSARTRPSQAHADLLDLASEHWPYELLAKWAWKLRLNLSIYDASYVALAELLDAEPVTLDRRIARAPVRASTENCSAAWLAKASMSRALAPWPRAPSASAIVISGIAEPAAITSIEGSCRCQMPPNGPDWLLGVIDRDHSSCRHGGKQANTSGAFPSGSGRSSGVQGETHCFLSQRAFGSQGVQPGE